MKLADAMIGLRGTRWTLKEKAVLKSQPTVKLAIQEYRARFPHTTRTEKQIRSAWRDKRRHVNQDYSRVPVEVEA